MKKEIPKPAVFGAVALVAIVIAYFGFRAASGPPEFPEPKRLPNYTEGIPSYVKEAREGKAPNVMGDTSRLTPEQKAAIDASQRAAGAPN